MFCSKCGKQNGKDSKFCNSCGNKFDNKSIESNSELNKKNKKPLIWFIHSLYNCIYFSFYIYLYIY